MGKKILFYFTLFLFVLAICLNADKFDYDLWARLIAGMGVVDGGHVLKADFLSYTPVHVWYDHEWGSGVVFYLFLKYFGPFSLIILEWLLYSGIFVVISRIIKIREQASPYNILFYIFPIMALVENFNNPVRCHLFSFFLFTLFIYFLEYARKRGKNFGLWLIPPIVIIWTNTHGGVVSGIGLLLMYAVGEFLNRKPFKKYLITFAVSAPLTLINPWGFDYVKFLLMANTMKRPDIIEWWGIFSKFHMFKQIMFKLFMLGVIVIEGAKFVKISKTAENLKTWYENLDKTKIILLLSTAYLAVKHVKLLPFFVITGTIFGYEDFFKLIKKGIKERKLSCIDCAVYLVQPIRIIATGIITFFAYAQTFHPDGDLGFIQLSYIFGNSWLWNVIVILQFCYTPFVIWYERREFKPKMVFYYFTYILYNFTWVPIAIQGMIGKNKTEWSHTKHTRTISMEELNRLNSK